MRKIVIGKLSEKPKPNSITVSNIHRLKLRIPNQISFHHEISKIIHDVLLLLLKVKKIYGLFLFVRCSTYNTEKTLNYNNKKVKQSVKNAVRTLITGSVINDKLLDAWLNYYIGNDANKIGDDNKIENKIKSAYGDCSSSKIENAFKDIINPMIEDDKYSGEDIGDYDESKWGEKKEQVIVDLFYNDL